MTGFARARGHHGDDAWVWEIKSVNARGLDIRVRLPSGQDEVETAIRDAIAKRFRRGSFFASLNSQRSEGDTPLQINRELLDQLLAVTQELGGQAPRVEALLSVRGVVVPADRVLDEDAEAVRRRAYIGSFGEALDDLEAARQDEGKRLAAILDDRLTEIETLVTEAETEAAARPEAMRERLAAQLAELLENVRSVPEERLAQELALIAVKGDVREEIDRLGAHIAQARDLLSEQAAVGRRLDFLCQEFNREANTLCAKSNDVSLTRIGLALKATIDQLREQVQNVE
ncbi:MAG: YicC family protein [Alphaproteobacteria bacterium]|nr:YicC family protein [Alphaproteobacteria bacterium]